MMNVPASEVPLKGKSSSVFFPIVQLIAIVAIGLYLLYASLLWLGAQSQLQQSTSSSEIEPDKYIHSDGQVRPGRDVMITAEEAAAIELRNELRSLKKFQEESQANLDAFPKNAQAFVDTCMNESPTPKRTSSKRFQSVDEEKSFQETISRLERPDLNEETVSQTIDFWQGSDESLKAAFIEAILKKPGDDDQKQQQRLAWCLRMIETWKLWNNGSVAKKFTDIVVADKSKLKGPIGFQILLPLFEKEERLTSLDLLNTMTAGLAFPSTPFVGRKRELCSTYAASSYHLFDIENQEFKKVVIEDSPRGELAREILYIYRSLPESLHSKIGEMLGSKDLRANSIARGMIHASLPDSVRDKLFPFAAKALAAIPVGDIATELDGARTIEQLLSQQTVDVCLRGGQVLNATKPAAAGVLILGALSQDAPKSLRQLGELPQSQSSLKPPVTSGTGVAEIENYLRKLRLKADSRIAAALCLTPALIEDKGVIEVAATWGGRLTKSALETAMEAQKRPPALRGRIEAAEALLISNPGPIFGVGSNEEL